MKLKDALAKARQLSVLAYPLQGIQVQIKVSKSYFDRELSSYYSEYMYCKGERANPDRWMDELGYEINHGEVIVWYEEGESSPILATYYPFQKKFVIGNLGDE